MFLNYSAPIEQKWYFLPWLLVKRLKKLSQQFFQNLESVIMEFIWFIARVSFNIAAHDNPNIIDCSIIEPYIYLIMSDNKIAG